MHWRGLRAAESAAAIVSFLGAIVTWALLPETQGKSLEEVTGENQSMADTDNENPKVSDRSREQPAA